MTGDSPNSQSTPPTLGERSLALRVVTMPRETNPYGTIFGGVIMSYIDQAGLVEALRHRNCTWVTASVERIDFRAPVHLGDIVNLYAKTVRTGTTSVTIEVEVEAQRRTTGECAAVTSATLTMVALGPEGKPTPYRTAPDARVFVTIAPPTGA